MSVVDCSVEMRDVWEIAVFPPPPTLSKFIERNLFWQKRKKKKKKQKSWIQRKDFELLTSQRFPNERGGPASVI